MESVGQAIAIRDQPLADFGAARLVQRLHLGAELGELLLGLHAEEVTAGRDEPHGPFAARLGGGLRQFLFLPNEQTGSLAENGFKGFWR